MQKFIQRLRSITLSDRERAALRVSLIGRMRESGRAQAVPSPWTWFLYARHTQVALLLLIIVVSYGSTVTLASENALPGDALYPIKTLVAEPLARVATPNTLSARADFETQLLDVRLNEAEALDRGEKLDAPLQETVREKIREQSAKAQTRVRDAVDDKKGGHEKERALKGVLDGHKHILEKLKLSDEDDN